jgi:ferritin-like metal-binding protein YciE
MPDLRIGQGSSMPALQGRQSIETLEALFFLELRELRSAELELAARLVGTAESLGNVWLERLVRGYATELNARCEDIERVLWAAGVDSRGHTGQAMNGLLVELVKMSQLGMPEVRGAAVIDALQRIVHVKIASYGSVATVARTLGRLEDAERFAEYAERERVADTRLSAMAAGGANRQALSGKGH